MAFLSPDFLWHLLSLVSMTLPGALGYNLLFGKGKIFHFGPVAASLASAYATFLVLGATGSYALAVLTGACAALAASLFFAWLALRLEPDGLGVLSIAAHLALLTVVLTWSSLTRGALGIPQIPRMPLLGAPAAFALAALMIALLRGFFLWLLHRGAFGRALAALAEHPWHAAALGISRRRIHTIAFLIAGLGAAIGGVLFPQYLHLLHPSDYGFSALVFLVMVVVAGGPGSVPGVVLSTFLLLLLKESLRFVPMPIAILGPLRLILFGLILFGAVWLRRDALFPQKRTV